MTPHCVVFEVEYQPRVYSPAAAGKTLVRGIQACFCMKYHSYHIIPPLGEFDEIPSLGEYYISARSRSTNDVLNLSVA